MAKTKRAAVKAEAEIRELTSTLVVDDITYNINAIRAEQATNADKADKADKADEATHAVAADKLSSNVNAGDSNTPVYFENGTPKACTELDLNTSGNAASADEAKKVQNTLTIYACSDPNGNVDNDITTVFDGSSEQAVSIVPADGGRFTGPVFIGNFNTNEYAYPKLAIVNRGQVENVVQALTGSPFYVWDGTNLTAQTAADSEVMLKVSTIVGTTEAYTALQNRLDAPEAYIYICTDGDCDVYFNAPNYENKKLVLGTESIKQLLKGIDANATAIGHILDGTTAANKANYLKVGTGYQDYSYFQKKITISPNNPSGGVDGDIWIKY